MIKLQTCIGRLSWVFIDKPQKPKKEGEVVKYSTEFLVPDEDMRKINPKTGKSFLEDMQQAIVDAWNEKVPPAKQVQLKNWAKIKSVLKFYQSDDETAQEYQKGCWRIAAKNVEKPGVVDAAVQRMDDEAIKKIKAGDYAKLILSVYAYSVDGSSGTSLGLQGIQWIRAGEPFAARVNLENEFSVEEIKEEDASAAFE